GQTWDGLIRPGQISKFQTGLVDGLMACQAPARNQDRPAALTGTEERELRGHGCDVKCVDWHPHKGLLVSGSKDSQQPIIL
ncbi:unnamed protein product, partial [Rotaria magnacalcarata]